MYCSTLHYTALLDHADEKRYKTAIGIGFGASFAVFVTMMLLGYSMFGTVAQPLLLNNFHRTQDMLATGDSLTTLFTFTLCICMHPVFTYTLIYPVTHIHSHISSLTSYPLSHVYSYLPT